MRNEGFLSRWSRRKAETQVEKSPAPHLETVKADPIPSVIPEPTSVQTQPASPELDVEAPVLPDIETLNGQSDFSAFMGDKVPEHLQRLALRKLWGSDPIFANLDGLNDYDEDFSIIRPLAEGVAEELKKLMKENAQRASEEQDDTPEADPELATDPLPTDVDQLLTEGEAENSAPQAEQAPQGNISDEVVTPKS